MFADEYTYAFLSKFPFAPERSLSAVINNWLYLRLYRLAHWGHGDFLVTARVINAGFCALSASAIFWLGTLWRDRTTSGLLGVGFAVFAGSSAAYFMPEAAFFSTCAVLVLAFAVYLRNPTVGRLMIVAGTGVLATSMKTHGILLLPALMLVTSMAQPRGTPERSGKSITHTALLAVGWYLGVTVLNWVLSGRLSLNPLGDLYGGIARSGLSLFDWQAMRESIVLAKNHLSTVALIAGVPMALALASAAKLLAPSRLAPSERPLALLNLSMLIAVAGMLAVTVTFQVSIVRFGGPFESLTRMHGRYYEHLMVLSAICGILAGTTFLDGAKSGRRAAFVAFVMAMLVAALFLTTHIGFQNPVDYSSAFALYFRPMGRYVAAFIAGLALLLSLAPAKRHWILPLGLGIWLGFKFTHHRSISPEPRGTGHRQGSRDGGGCRIRRGSSKSRDRIHCRLEGCQHVPGSVSSARRGRDGSGPRPG